MQSLLATHTYDAITVTELLTRAHVSRSSFYRHYRDKLDVLADLHRGWFDRLELTDQDADAWLSLTPAPGLTAMFTSMGRAAGGARTVFLHIEGMVKIEQELMALLAGRIETSLTSAFGAERLSLPPRLLALGVCGVLRQLLGALLDRSTNEPPEELATQAQRMIRSLVSGALQPSPGDVSQPGRQS